MLAQWTLKWDNATYSFIQEFNGQYDEFGKWNQPFPNNSEDSYAFGLLERWGQGEGRMFFLMLEHGEPNEISVERI